MYDNKTEIVENNIKDAKKTLNLRLEDINKIEEKFKANPRSLTYEDYVYLMEIIYPAKINTIMEILEEKAKQKERNILRSKLR